ncbi:hypothetical protein SAMN05444161_7998 [Rhizobiales bacterium GAS191]|nr:hypothetical protein SAMN05519104_3500 [Rhizobiales bacterium GAS188]SEE94138.1 hypothetical protein SAMN05444161_7998 [Rhizobiales bacterium GAS191]
MKHATAQSLDRLEALLTAIRALATLKEKSRGVFYLRSRAALHFHEDPAGLFADLRLVGDWQRLPVNSFAEQAVLMRELAKLPVD